MNWKCGVVELDQIAVGEHLGDAAPADEQDKGGDDRLDPERVMSQPLNKPKAPATRTGTTKASAMPTIVARSARWLSKIIGASAPAIAISEPTERSMPPVAMHQRHADRRRSRSSTPGSD